MSECRKYDKQFSKREKETYDQVNQLSIGIVWTFELIINFSTLTVKFKRIQSVHTYIDDKTNIQYIPSWFSMISQLIWVLIRKKSF